MSCPARHPQDSRRPHCPHPQAHTIRSERWSDPELKPLVSESEGLLERESRMGRVSKRDPLTAGVGNLSTTSDPSGSRGRKLKEDFPKAPPRGLWSMLSTARKKRLLSPQPASKTHHAQLTEPVYPVTSCTLSLCSPVSTGQVMPPTHVAPGKPGRVPGPSSSQEGSGDYGSNVSPEVAFCLLSPPGWGRGGSTDTTQHHMLPQGYSGQEALLWVGGHPCGPGSALSWQQ